MKALLICGPSGSGKSTFVRQLIRQYPDKYIKAVQYTTRPRREGEAANEYVFVTPEEFKKVHSSLVGITHVNGNVYGSKIDFKEERIQIFILNKEGIADFQYMALSFEDAQVKTLGVYRDLEKCCAARTSRDPEFIKDEFKTLSLANAIFQNVSEDITPEVISDLDEVIQKLFGE